MAWTVEISFEMVRFSEVIVLIGFPALLYANDEQRTFHMRPLLTIKPWNKIANPEIFALARAEYGTVVWPGIAPETLFDDSVPT